VPKGRILDEALPLMARAGWCPSRLSRQEASARSFACEASDMRIIRVRAFDVATFVAHGAAQIGIVGSDVVEEFAYSRSLRARRSRYRPLPPVGRRAGRAAGGDSQPCQPPARRQQVSQPHPPPFRRQGIQAEVVKLNGAMELAPGLGLASRIVDLVSTGRR
jgi:ATP phosphoribosyltransferase